MTARDDKRDEDESKPVAPPLTVLKALNEYHDWLVSDHNPFGGHVEGCPRCEKIASLNKLIDEAFTPSHERAKWPGYDPAVPSPLESAPSTTQRSEPSAHDWQPDGGELRFESHPGGEAPHVHTTCAKCDARAWFLEYQWELLSKGCARSATRRSGDRRVGVEDRRTSKDRRVAFYKFDTKGGGKRLYNRRDPRTEDRRNNSPDGGKQT